MVREAPLRLAPGQTRPVAFKLSLRTPDLPILRCIVKYKTEDVTNFSWSDQISFELVSSSLHKPHRITFLHPSQTVSYAILRAPSNDAARHANPREAWPIMLGLHGAGVEADSEQVRDSFDAAPDLQCWLVSPTGMTPWSGDDWRKSLAPGLMQRSENCRCS